MDSDTRQQNFHDNGPNVYHYQQIRILLHLVHQKHIFLTWNFPLFEAKLAQPHLKADPEPSVSE
ncbi:hypothetical protein HKD37_10G028974 [Glycine soja]